LVAENPSLADSPSELRVTLESAREASAGEPGGQTIIAWPSQSK